MSKGNADEKRLQRVALVGIAATAAVGLAGVVTNLFVAKADRHQQAKLANDARVYNRRANAYLAAMRAGYAFQRVSFEVVTFSILSTAKQKKTLSATDKKELSAETKKALSSLDRRREALTLGSDVDSDVRAFGSEKGVKNFRDTQIAALNFAELAEKPKASSEKLQNLFSTFLADLAYFNDGVRDDLG
jgi:hypothetical protein